MSLDAHQLLILQSSIYLFFNFFFYYCSGICIRFKNPLPNLRPKTSMFSPKSFIALPFILRSLIHFELIFLYGVRLGVQLHCFVSSPPLDSLGNFVANQLAIDIWDYFWILNYILLVYIFILMPKYIVLIIVALL